jgi:hypothetical protein
MNKYQKAAGAGTATNVVSMRSRGARGYDLAHAVEAPAAGLDEAIVYF